MNNILLVDFTPKKSRFHSAEQIERLIDRANERKQNLVVAIAQGHSAITTLIRESEGTTPTSALKAEVEAMEKRLSRTTASLLRLKNKLSEIRTPLLPGVEGDGSVNR